MFRFSTQKFRDHLWEVHIMSHLMKIMRISSASMLLLLISQPAAAQTSGLLNYWKQPADNWSLSSNWSRNVLPNGQDSFNGDDFAIIGGQNAGGTVGVSTGAATINTNIAEQPGGITLGVAAANSGTLQISSGGSITVADTPFEGNGYVYVGLAGTGTLNVDRGGSLTAVAIYASGSTASLIHLGGTTGAGSAVVNVGDAILSRTTQVVGPNVDFTSANLVLTEGTLIEQITGASHSPLKATIQANLAGTLKFTFGPGVVPAVGSSWNLVNAQQVAGTFGSIDLSLTPQLALGQVYNVRTQPGGLGKLVQLAVEERLVLNVDRATHAVSIANPGTAGISIDGYSVHSAALNGLNPGNFVPLGGAWQIANASTSRVNQLNPSAVPTFATLSSTSLGNIFAPPTPAAFGDPTEDLTFEYTQPGSSTTVAGVVNYIGTTGINNLVLRVDPSNGAAQLKNTSTFSESIDAYTITSTYGSLDTGQWTSLADQGAAGGDWQEGGPTTISANRVSELKKAGSTLLNSNDFYNIGNPFNETAAKRDLVFQYLLQGESTPRTGVVVYESISAGIPGDYDGNGVVNAADYVVWRKYQNTTHVLPNDPTGGTIGAAQYTTWRSHFGAPPGSGSSGLGAQAVPEPASAALIVIAVGIVFAAVLPWRSNRLRPAPCIAFRK
jgi:hypothetical protein